MPLAFTVAPCNARAQFKTVLANAQYNSARVREAAWAYGAEPVIPVRRDSRVKDGLKVGRDFVTRARAGRAVQGEVERGEAVW